MKRAGSMKKLLLTFPETGSTTPLLVTQSWEEGKILGSGP